MANVNMTTSGDDTIAKIQRLALVKVPDSVRAALARGCKALVAVAAYHRRAAERVTEVEYRAQIGMRPIMKQIADSVPSDSGLYGEGRARVIATAQANETDKQRRGWSREVANASLAITVPLAQEAIESFRALDVAIEAERLKWLGPSSLRDDAPKTLEQHLAEQRLAHELEAAGVDYIEQTYAGALKIGDVDRVQKIEAAGRPFLLRVVDDNARAEERRKSARGGGRTTDGAAASKAIALLARFEQERQARVPVELQNAVAAREAFGALFSTLLGINARYLSSEAFAARFLDGDPTRVHDRYEIDPRWPMRFAPPNAPLAPAPSPMRMR